MAIWAVSTWSSSGGILMKNQPKFKPCPKMDTAAFKSSKVTTGLGTRRRKSLKQNPASTTLTSRQNCFSASQHQWIFSLSPGHPTIWNFKMCPKTIFSRKENSLKSLLASQRFLCRTHYHWRRRDSWCEWLDFVFLAMTCSLAQSWQTKSSTAHTCMRSLTLNWAKKTSLCC